jgi:hypothetical protein
LWRRYFKHTYRATVFSKVSYKGSKSIGVGRWKKRTDVALMACEEE